MGGATYIPPYYLDTFPGEWTFTGVNRFFFGETALTLTVNGT